MDTKESSTVDPTPMQKAPMLAFEPDKYLDHVADLELTEAEKVEFLRALWDIMATFVRMGFGVESVLQTLFQEASANATDGIETSVPTHEFNVSVDDLSGGPK